MGTVYSVTPNNTLFYTMQKFLASEYMQCVSLK